MKNESMEVVDTLRRAAPPIQVGSFTEITTSVLQHDIVHRVANAIEAAACGDWDALDDLVNAEVIHRQERASMLENLSQSDQVRRSA